MGQTLENYPPGVNNIKSVATPELRLMISHYRGSRRVVGRINPSKIREG